MPVPDMTGSGPYPVLKKWKRELDDWPAAGPTLADITANHQKEILMLTVGGHLYVYNPDGGLVWDYNTPGHTACLYSEIAVGDIAGDYYYDIAFNIADTWQYISYIYILDKDGNPACEPIEIEPSCILSPPTLADVDADGKKEIIVGNCYADGFSEDDGYLYVYDIVNGQAQQLWQRFFNHLQHPGFSISAVGDIDNDTKPEILVVVHYTEGDKLYAVNAEDGSDVTENPLFDPREYNPDNHNYLNSVHNSIDIHLQKCLNFNWL